jgi:hypothetical protein
MRDFGRTGGVALFKVPCPQSDAPWRVLVEVTVLQGRRWWKAVPFLREVFRTDFDIVSGFYASSPLMYHQAALSNTMEITTSERSALTTTLSDTI